MSMIYKIEAAEKRLNKSTQQIESGDTIIWDKAKNEKTAKYKAETMLKDERVLSVWINVYNDDIVYQWVKYKGDTNWKGTPMG